VFDLLFTCRDSVARHELAPLLEARVCFLQHCRECGSPRGTLRRVARELLVVIDQLRLLPEGEVHRKTSKWQLIGGRTANPATID
jgi:hypothetical protein